MFRRVINSLYRIIRVEDFSQQFVLWDTVFVALVYMPVFAGKWSVNFI